MRLPALLMAVMLATLPSVAKASSTVGSRSYKVKPASSANSRPRAAKPHKPGKAPKLVRAKPPKPAKAPKAARPASFCTTCVRNS